MTNRKKTTRKTDWKKPSNECSSCDWTKTSDDCSSKKHRWNLPPTTRNGLGNDCATEVAVAFVQTDQHLQAEAFGCGTEEAHANSDPGAADRTAGRMEAVPVVNGDPLDVDCCHRRASVWAGHRPIVSCRDGDDPDGGDPDHDVDPDGADQGDDCSNYVASCSARRDQSIDCDDVPLVVISIDCATCALLFAKSIDHAIAALFLLVLLTC